MTTPLQTDITFGLVNGTTVDKLYPGLPTEALAAAAAEFKTGLLSLSAPSKGKKPHVHVVLVPAAQVASITAKETES